jgi:transcriptional regulator with XRE-family HTH domain
MVRISRHQTLRDVATSAGISESFLSQIELGRSNASIDTLRRVAATLGMTLGDLFDEDFDRELHVVRADTRPVLEFGAFGRKFQIHTAPYRSFDVLLCEFEPGGSTGEDPYTHGDSEEVALVLDGSVRFMLGTRVVTMGAGDSIAFRTNIPHRVDADPHTGARVLFITSPPSL